MIIIIPNQMVISSKFGLKIFAIHFEEKRKRRRTPDK
jgi:hypothetical protein